VAFPIYLHYLSKIKMVNASVGFVERNHMNYYERASTFIHALSHSNRKALIIITWQHMLLKCVM
jgi:hypothetical protein